MGCAPANANTQTNPPPNTGERAVRSKYEQLI